MGKIYPPSLRQSHFRANEYIIILVRDDYQVALMGNEELTSEALNVGTIAKPRILGDTDLIVKEPGGKLAARGIEYSAKAISTRTHPCRKTARLKK